MILIQKDVINSKSHTVSNGNKSTFAAAVSGDSAVFGIKSCLYDESRNEHTQPIWISDTDCLFVCGNSFSSRTFIASGDQFSRNDPLRASSANPFTTFSAPLVYYIYFTLYTLFLSFG